MSKPRRLSGDDLIAILSTTIPRHKELDAGTVRAIFRQASRYIPEDQLRVLLYVD